ncbi:MAG TPA: hypothetical protein VNK46_09845 [Nitrospiraceae bacterium]|jgi:hypothetical protein|nr:hypothetical protein [Nitrospiraceae bacterium]
MSGVCARFLRGMIFSGTLAAALALPLLDLAWAGENRWGFGTDLGFWSGTTDGTVFALGFNLDYYLDRSFSFGPMMVLAPTGDLTQIAFAGVAKYHVRLNNDVNLVPFAGIGLVHADLDRGTGPNRIDRNDTSHFIPLGLSAEFQATRNIALATTLMVNLHHITLSPPVPTDNTSVAVMFGIRFGP